MDAIKLLLADDDQLLASLLDFRLKKAGYQVKVCTDGKSVKKYLETETATYKAAVSKI